MRKIIALDHISLDGFAATPNGEIDWIKISDELFDFVGTLTDKADGVIYGRVTWQMMDDYWPEAANRPNPTKHEKEHSEWYNNVDKLVVSASMAGTQKEKTTFTANPLEDIQQIKNQPGSNILLLGSPSIVRLLTENKLIDEYMFFINPILIGKGISVFPDAKTAPGLHLENSRIFSHGVNLLHYTSKQTK